MAPSGEHSSMNGNANEEAIVRRNPHGDFKAVEASRPTWEDITFHYTQVRKPGWKFGDGASDKEFCAPERTRHVSIDPYAEGRSPLLNYKLLTSTIIPRPIGFLSTLSKDGTKPNLAPFSYTMAISHDPPTFIVAFAGGFVMPRDSLINLRDTGECVLNIVGEGFLEAMNSTSVDAPSEIDEWKVSGLTMGDTEVVKPKRVVESAFSVEGKLMRIDEFESKSEPGVMHCAMAIIEGVRFWAREDGINAEGTLMDPAVLRPVARLGGISYGRMTSGIELPRPAWEDVEKWAVQEGLYHPKANGHS